MTPDTAALPDNNRLALRQVARGCRKAALSTLQDGAPYVSLVTVAFDHDLSPILLLSQLADHTRNLMADDRVALLLDGTDGHPNPQTGPRVTLTGRVVKTDDPRLKDRFLARHPGAAMYAGFTDFALWRVVLERAHFVGGFGRAVWFDAPFGLDPDLMTAWTEAETSQALAATLADATAQWRQGGQDGQVVGIDCDGLDIACEDTFIRKNFPAQVETIQAFSSAMAALFAQDRP